jgi:WD40 repeat protein
MIRLSLIIRAGAAVMSLVAAFAIAYIVLRPPPDPKAASGISWHYKSNGSLEWTHHVAFSPDGKLFAIFAQGAPWTGIYRLPYYRYAIQTLDFEVAPYANTFWSPDSSMVVLITPGGNTLNVMKVTDGTTQVRLKHDGKEVISTTDYAPNGQFIASGDYAGTVTVFDAQSGKPVNGFKLNSAPILHVSFSSDAGTLIAQDSSSARLWNLKTGELIQSFDSVLTMVSGSLDRSVFSFIRSGADGRKEFEVHRYDTGELVQKFDGSSMVFALSRSGTELATSDGNIWDVKTGALRRKLVDDGTGFGYTFLQFSPDGKVVAAVRGDEVKLIDVETGEVRQTENTSGYALFAPSGACLATRYNGWEFWDRMWSVGNSAEPGDNQQ